MGGDGGKLGFRSIQAADPAPGPIFPSLPHSQVSHLLLWLVGPGASDAVLFSALSLSLSCHHQPTVLQKMNGQVRRLPIRGDLGVFLLTVEEGNTMGVGARWVAGWGFVWGMGASVWAE